MARKKKKKPDAATLARVNRFNLGALTSNRQGRLTSGQTWRFALRLTSMLLSIIVTSAFGIACIVLPAVFMSRETFEITGVSLFFAALCALLGLVWIIDAINHARRQIWPLLRDVVGGEVTVEEGTVSRDYDDNSYASLWHNLFTWVLRSFAEDHAKHIWWFSGVHYYVVNGQRFTVSQKGYAALTEELPWRLYYASHSKRLVNIEPVLGNTNL
jgi:hypothetical protein